MVTVNNPVEASYSIALGNHSTQRAKLMEAATTGQKQDITVVDTILGSKARSAANLGGKIITGMGTGFSIVSTATTVLKNIRDQLDNIKQDIATLSNADAQTLDIAEANYTAQVGRIFAILQNTDFAGKRLFDGTLADAPAVRLPSQSLPTNAAPLSIQAGINTGDAIDIVIPRLLSGDGTIVNVVDDGVFDPLFPITDNARAALAALNTVLQTPVDINTIDPALVLINNRWDGINMTGSYGDQIRLIEQALPSNVNLEQDIIRELAIEAFRSVATVFAGAERSVSAGNYLNYAKAAASTISLSNANLQEVNDARTIIMGVVNAIIANNDLAAVERVKLVNIPNDPTTTYAQQVLREFALTYFDLNSDPPNGGDRLTPFINRLNGLIYGTGTRALVNNIQSRSFPNPIFIGSVKTPSSRLDATRIMDNAIRSLDSAITKLTAQQNALTAAKANLEDLVKELHTAADNYLSTDYEKVIPELTKLLREDRVASLAFGLSERAINAIISQMENVAAAAA